MKNFLALFLILFSGVAFAASGSGNITNVEAIAAGCLNVSEGNSQGYFSVGLAPAGGQGAGSVYHFNKNFAPYQIATNKVFHVVAQCYNGSTAGYQGQLMYGDNNFTDGAGVGSITNPVYENGAATAYGHPVPTANTWFCECRDIDFPSNATGKYVAWQAGSAIRIDTYLVGKEK